MCDFGAELSQIEVNYKEAIECAADAKYKQTLL